MRVAYLSPGGMALRAAFGGGAKGEALSVERGTYAQKILRLFQNVLPHPPPIIESGPYSGPDRRSPHYQGPERRRENLTRQGGANLSEEEIKVLLKKN